MQQLAAEEAMISKFLRVIFLGICLCASSITHADIKIVYVNGIWNGADSDSKESMELLRSVLKRNGLVSKYPGELKIKNYYNPHFDKPGDIYELQEQAKIASKAVEYALLRGANPDNPENSPYYKKYIGQEYLIKINSGEYKKESAYKIYTPVKDLFDLSWQEVVINNNQIVFVAHSQGNFILEALDALVAEFNNNRLNDGIRYVGFGSVAMTSPNNAFVNIEQDQAVYNFLPFDVSLNVTYGKTYFHPPVKSVRACSSYSECDALATQPRILIRDTGDLTLHQVASVYLNKNVRAVNGESIDKLVSKNVTDAVNILRNRNKKISSVYIPQPQKLAWFTSTLNKSLAIFGISNAVAQSVSDLFAFTSTSYTVRVDGTGFDNNEAVTVEGSTCDASTIQRGTGYFTQTCQGGSQAGNSYKIRVYDTQYDLDIELPPAYQFMSLRGPVLAPTAPVLTDLGSGTIRSTWGAVVGATGYELSSGQTLIAATGASQTTYDHANQLAGSQVCYRVRAIASSVPSANSAETCITLAAPKCSGQWVAGQYVVGQTESTTQNCSVGYSGNKQLTHTCQANGSWGATTTQDNCTLIPPVTCSGTWSVAQYLVNQTETKTEACTGGQTGSVITNHICRANGTWGPSLETISCTCPAGKVLTNGVCTTPAPTSCNGSWTNTAYAIGAVEEQFANACPAGTVGQVRSFHTCQAGGTWSPTANSDNCTAVLVAPTNLIASSVAAGGSSGVAGIQLVWTAVPGATRYYINRNGEANYSSQAVTNWTDPNVVSGTQYCYTLNAFSNFNNSRSPASSQVCATYQPTQIIILPPTNVAAAQYISGGRKAIRLTWTSANGADSYQVYRLDRSGIFATLAGADTSFIDWPELSLTSGGSYAYVIRSVKNGVVSPDSNVGQAIAP
jgi:hypothetical protein